MKKKLKMVLTCTLALAMLVTATLTAASQSKIKSFSDVPKNYWGYQTIMDMTELGLFKGTTAAVNGVATFSPEKTMTRAEFITVVLRAAYPAEAAKITNTSGEWWRGYYELALKKSLLAVYDLDSGDLSKPMTREEMAMVLVRCVNMQGETAEKWVSTEKIADYASVKPYYREFVRECFSLGLICGIDSKGTFAPAKSLTRAEAATVLNRLIEKSQRIEVEFDDDAEIPSGNTGNAPGGNVNGNTGSNTGSTVGGNNGNSGSVSGGNTGNNSGTVGGNTGGNNNSDEEEEEEDSWKLPWEEEDAKQPSEYTWTEYEALTEKHKQAFQNTFGSMEAFDAWLEKAHQNFFDEMELPWENGGKQPSEYTWEEYEALTVLEKIAFQNSFENVEAFDAWLQNAESSFGGNAGTDEDENVNGNTGNDEGETEVICPWDDPNAKQPSAYTWAEFEALNAGQQMAFQNSFGSIEAFEAWMQNAQSNAGSNDGVYKPWENGGKQPSAYTWAEFEALDAGQQMAFQNSFGSAEAFDAWMQNAQSNAGSSDGVYKPWENGGKQPSAYTWAEFEALDAGQQMAFQNSFGSIEAFDAWLQSVNPQ